MNIFGVTIDFTNVVTICIIITILFFAILGLCKGFTRSIIAFLCLGASVALALILKSDFIEFLNRTFRWDLEGNFVSLFEKGAPLAALQTAAGGTPIAIYAAQIVSSLILFIIFQLIFGVIAGFIYKVIGTVRPTLSDSLIGMVFYAAIGVVAVFGLLLVASLIPVDAIQISVASSKLATAMQDWILKIIPL